MTIFIWNFRRIKSYKTKAMEIFFVKRSGWPAAALVLILDMRLVFNT